MEAFTLFGLTVYPYGLSVAAAAALSLLLAGAQVRRAGLKPGTLSWFAPLAVPLAVLAARAAYCLICFDWFLQKGVGYFFHLTEGGFVLYGALAGGLLAAWLAARVTRQSFARLADALAAPSALMIALCRLAEGLVGQGYGRYVTDWFDPESGMSLSHPEDTSFFQRFPFAVCDMYDEYSWAIFVLEAIIALVICVAVARTRERAPGGRALLFLLLYAASQALCEGLREDAVLRWGFVRVSQIISAVVVAAVLLICCVHLPQWRARRGLIAGAWCGTLCGMLLVIAMEFAVEKKIVFLEFLPMDVCYLITALAGVLMVCSILPVWRRAMPLVSGRE